MSRRSGATRSERCSTALDRAALLRALKAATSPGVRELKVNEPSLAGTLGGRSSRSPRASR
jgi:hypothetical protein